MSDDPNLLAGNAGGIGQEVLTAALNAAQEGLLLASTDGKVLYVNPEANELLGTTSSDCVGRPLAELANGYLTAAVSADEVWSSVQIGERTVEIYSRELYASGQRYLLTSLQDATARVDTERSLRSRIAFENLVISIAATFITLEPNELDEAIDSTLGRIAQVAGVDRAYVYRIDEDECAMTLTNVWSAEGGGERFKQRKSPTNTFEDRLEKLRANEPVVYEIVEQLDDGTRRPRSSLCVPMMRRSSLRGFVGFDALWEAATWREEIVQLLKLVGFVFSATLSRRSALLREQQAYATLEQKVIERTDELQNKQTQLAQAEKLASLGQLVAGVAHEVNTPLGAIKSNNDVLIRMIQRMTEAHPEPSGKNAKLLEIAKQTLDVNHEAIRRIEKIVGSLRQFARLDQAEIDTVNIHTGIDNTLTLLHHEIKHRVQIVKEYGDLPEVECFPNRLNQVFMNLLVNAAQAIKEKGEIKITTYQRDNRCVIEITDSGVGIPQEHIERIFNPGFTTKGVGIGTGLGLSIVQGIVTDHGGHLEVESEPGSGSLFRVFLPLRLPVRASGTPAAQ